MDIPVFGTLFVRGGQSKGNSESVNALYEAIDDATRIQKSSRLPETDYQRDMRLLLTDAQKAVSAISQLQRMEYFTEHRRKLEDLKNGTARDAVGQFRSGNPDRTLGQQRRKQAEEMLKIRKPSAVAE